MLTTTPSPTPNLEGAPWWVNAGLLALTTVAGVITTVVIRRQNSSPTTPPPPDPNPGPAVPAVPPVAMQALPTTADGQLELAKQLVAEVVRDRDETRAELIEAQAMVNRLTARVRDQDVTIARLQQLLAMPPPPQYPQAPPPPGPRH